MHNLTDGQYFFFGTVAIILVICAICTVGGMILDSFTKSGVDNDR